MRTVVISGTLAILGVLAMAFAPFWGVTGCVECVEGYDGPLCGCHTFTDSLAVPIRWRGDWAKLGLSMSIIGLALVVTGIVLLIRATRTKDAVNTAR
jgi:uncharacterized membrane protein